MCRLLIVSDDLQEQSMLQQSINDSFMNIKILPPATTKVEALKITEEFLPEILLISIDHLDIDGFIVKRKIVQTLPNIKVIILTEHESFQSLHQALRCGVIDYLLTPVDFDELKVAIDRCVRSLNQVSLMDVLNNKPTVLAKEQINTILDYIHEHYNEEINLTTLADIMHLNRHYVSRFFKEAVGMNFIDYLTAYRIEKAKQLLMKTEESITEISGTVGYIDSTYFSKLFKKKVGQSPHQFRKQYHGEHTPADLRIIYQ
ncbi:MULTISPECIES: helix-turn-helix transcriptional regulator [unclassified Enterococcus]|uniref:helix-turn-helix transcriptional regulator n=1 Tax=unclassified Enterococcus TaxID=2608891 RepID=UPI001CE0B8C1|nr:MULTISPECIES: helix-turn-helix domain-containing protein [unclassified Enterococcus]MCA5012858.1 DNA-binding response regulator [Enterococcus sp. S23]MCA5016109.1 DNA-binding response regulator [Enterococcus sp. S22(2020)]